MKRKLLQEALRKTILNTRIFGTIFFRVRNRHQRCSMKKGVLKNFARSTGKHLCQSLFFNLNFAKFLRTPFLQNTTGQLFLPCLDWILVDPGPSIVRIRTHIYFTMRITWIWDAYITAQKNEEILNNKNHFLYSVFSYSREWWIWEHKVVYSGIRIPVYYSDSANIFVFKLRFPMFLCIWRYFFQIRW